MRKAEIFKVPVTKCVRCGKLLVSEFGLKHGMGPVCKRKWDIAHAPIDKNQLTLFSEPDDEEKGGMK